MDYTIEKFLKYNGEEWMMLQNGEKIIIAKKKSVLKIKNGYTLLDDRERILNVNDWDIICLIKEKI